MNDETVVALGTSNAGAAAIKLKTNLEPQIGAGSNSKHNRKVSLKVQKSFNTAYKDIIDENWKLTESDPKYTLFDSKYVQRGGKVFYRNDGELSK